MRLLLFALAIPVSFTCSSQTDSLFVNGLQRTYTVRLPSAYDGNTALPLVVALHGGFGSGLQLEEQSLLTGKAEQEGFIVVYPDGVASPFNIRTWNAGGCCGYAVDNNIDDVGFIRALLDTLIGELAIDTLRIYATGMSNGGFMSYRLACEMSDRIAAIAPVSASMAMEQCQPARPVPVIGIHSYLDASVPWQGGVGTGLSDHWNAPQDSVQNAFAQYANCTMLNDTVQNNADLCVVRWHPCDCQTEVLLYMTHDGGHSWPGGAQMPIGDPPSQVVNANDLMWEFFEQYSLDCAGTGMKEPEEAPVELQLFPQPTDGFVSVHCPMLKRIEVFDGAGQLVHRQYASGTDQLDLNLSALAPGCYVLHATQGTGARITAPVIVF